MYENKDEVHHRLTGTIVLHKNVPAMVDDAHDMAPDGKQKLGVILRDCPAFAARYWCSLDSPDLVYNKFNLGFINMGTKCYFMCRTPVRKFKQGLNGDNVIVQSIDGEAGARARFQNCITSKGFVEMFKDEYPSLKNALDTVQKKDVISIPFDRKFAILKDELDLLSLYYKTSRIGYSENGESFKIHPRFAFLRELIDEKGIKVVIA